MVKVADFTEKQLLADIRFMEEIGREHDAAKRREPQRLPNRLSPMLQELRREVEGLSAHLCFCNTACVPFEQISGYLIATFNTRDRLPPPTFF